MCTYMHLSAHFVLPAADGFLELTWARRAASIATRVFPATVVIAVSTVTLLALLLDVIPTERFLGVHKAVLLIELLVNHSIHHLNRERLEISVRNIW